MDRNRALLDAIRQQDSVSVQNTLMRMNDIDIALAMYYLHETDRTFVLSFVGERKARNVVQQQNRLEIVKVKDEQVDSAIALLMKRLSGAGPGAGSSTKKYFRPGTPVRSR